MLREQLRQGAPELEQLRRRRPLNVLGIHWGEHDSSAALLQDGRIVAAAEEERFNRIKHAPFAFPLQAARYCLGAGSISASDLDIVASSFNPWTDFGRGFAHSVRHFPRSNFIALAEAVRRGWYLLTPSYARYSLKLPKTTRCIAVPHHLAHAASAFYCSPFEQAAVLVVDGIGEWVTTSLYKAAGSTIELLASINFPHSLGLCYSAFTEFLGFEPFDGEYKVMGMAAYGGPQFRDRLREIVAFPTRGGLRLDLRYFNFQRDYGRTTWYSPLMIEAFGKPCVSDGMPAEVYLDIAASLQERLEEAMLYLVQWLRRRTGLRNLCLAGGVALNSVANGKLVRRGEFERLFVQPAAHDAGCALGAALHAQAGVHSAARPEPLRHVYLGPEYTSQEVAALLDRNGLDYRILEDRASAAAELLAQEKIVGWFQGRMEFGPRALGNRSILASPLRSDTKDRINAAVKFREPFRPFAPSVRKEDSSTYFEDVGGSPYMVRVTQVKPGVGQRIPAVTHVDNSARLHTVSRDTNPLYWDLLGRFGERTGISVLLNTSFNVRGEPIVCTPEQAIACFVNSGLDALVIDKYLLTKKRRPV